MSKYMMKKYISVLFVAISVAAVQLDAQNRPNVLDELDRSGDFAPMFPFLPTHDAPDNITNVRTWTGVSNAPAGSEGFITAQGDHFVDGNGNVRRFIGTNIGMTGCFPDHASAERVAAEMARYGINIVRMHYVSHRSPEVYPVKDCFLEPVQLERFDYFFNQLKQHGIYVYFQLNISRKFRAENGIVNPGQLPQYKKGVDNVDTRMIELQKMFHRDILEHVNPYTGLAYRDDPAISMMELANENSIIDVWFNPKYEFTGLVEPYKGNIKSLWNLWLLNKYGSTENVKKAWLAGTEGDGTELMPRGVMKSAGSDGALLQKDNGFAEIVYMPAKKSDRLKGNWYLHMNVEKIPSAKDRPILYWTGLSFRKDEPYCLKFRMRSDRNMNVKVRIAQHHDPWVQVAAVTSVKTDGEWKEFTVNFISAIDDSNVRVTLSGFEVGTVDVADISLKSGFDYSWPKGQDVMNMSIDWPYRYNWNCPPQRAVDFTDFLAGLEYRYITDLYANAKNNLHVRQNVTGTQLEYGFNQPLATMDYCDMHAYWCHPAFRKGWKWDHFMVRNSPAMRSWGNPAEVMANVARARILGKPMTISEYDHPNMNQYCAEGDIMMSALGAFQNWSAFMQFAWILDTDYDRTHMNRMFDMCSAPQKLVHFPACYAMFVRGDVRKGSQAVTFAYPSERMADIKAVAEGQSAASHGMKNSYLLKALPLAVVSGRDVRENPELFSAEGKTVIRSEEDVPDWLKQSFKNRIMKSTTGELTWSWQEKNGEVFMVDTQKSKVFSGFVRGRSFIYRGMQLTSGRTRLDWLTLTLTMARPYGKTRPGNILSPGEYLLAATGLVKNTDEVAVVPEGKEGYLSNSVAEGGNEGHAPVLCEGIPARLVFAGLGGRVRCHALGPDGSRMMEVPVESNESGEAVLNIGPEYRTVWYELIVEQQ